MRRRPYCIAAPCLLYNAGGQIWLLLSASARDSAFEMGEAIDLRLHAQYEGRLSFSLGTARVRGVDFIEKTLPPAQVVAISPVLAFGMMIVLIAWTRRYLLALRERRIREQQLSQAP